MAYVKSQDLNHISVVWDVPEEMPYAFLAVAFGDAGPQVVADLIEHRDARMRWEDDGGPCLA